MYQSVDFGKDWNLMFGSFFTAFELVAGQVAGDVDVALLQQQLLRGALGHVLDQHALHRRRAVPIIRVGLPAPANSFGFQLLKMKGPEPAALVFSHSWPKSPLASCSATSFLSTHHAGEGQAVEEEARRVGGVQLDLARSSGRPRAPCPSRSPCSGRTGSG